MSEQAILRKIQGLPDSLQKEVLDFIENLIQKYRKQKQEKVIPKYGSLKGTFQMSDDFDEPLEDFKDYM